MPASRALDAPSGSFILAPIDGRDEHRAVPSLPCAGRPAATAHPAGGASMTQTPTRPVPADKGAANQTGAVINKNAYAEAQDFLPLKGLDYVEFWVGNARQAAHYFRALLGFTPVAYSGLETGIRDRTSWVMRQNDITIVLTGALGPDGEIAEHVHRHGDGVHDVAFAVDDVRSAWTETTARGAASYVEFAEAGNEEDGT